jgi:hypothetical protein
MSSRIQYASFLVRLWRLHERSGNGILAEWQSEVEHIQSGNTWKFHSLEGLETFLHRHALEPEGLVWTEAQSVDQ